MYKNNYENDYMYDWVLKKNGKPIVNGPTVIAETKPFAEIQPQREERKDNGRQ